MSTVNINRVLKKEFKYRFYEHHSVTIKHGEISIKQLLLFSKYALY